MEEEAPEIIVPLTNDLETKIADMFDIFDSTGTRRLENKEIPTVIRCLGLCPNNEQIEGMMTKMMDYTSPKVVHLIKFLPVVVKALTEHDYEPATPDVLLEAFRVLDEENRGYLTVDELSQYITTYGEVFDEDELEELLATAVDPYTGLIPYEYFMNQLMHCPETEETNLFLLADRVERERPPPPPPPKRFSQLVLEMAGLAQKSL